MPARSHSSARPELRTAPTRSASAESATPLVEVVVGVGQQSVLAWTDGLLGTARTDAGAQPAPELCVSCLRRSGIARDTPLRSVVCGPCWAAGDDDISTVELDEPAAGPVDSALPRTAIEWFRALLGSEWFQQRRRDAAGRLRGLLSELALRADWEDHSTWPTWERLQSASGWGRSSTAAWLAELQQRGWLLRLEHGTTPRFRPMALQHLEGNRAAVYQLRIPTEDAETRGIPTRPAEPPAPTAPTTWTPTHPPKHDLKTSPVTPTRASTLVHTSQVTAPNRANDGPTGPGHDPTERGYFASRVPVTGAEMLAAGLELRDADRALRRLSPRWIRTLMKPWWQAGWTNRDLLHALDHRPAAGRSELVLRCPAAQLRRPDGWVRHRLSAWQDASGPLVSPSADARRRAQVQATRGHAAAERLPYGASELHSADLHVTEQEHAAATEQLVRQWAAEFHDHRARPRLDEDIATPETARAHYQQISAALPRTRDTDQHQTPQTATPPPPADPPTALPARENPASAHDRALARARAERTGTSRPPPLTRRHRRFR